jgi:hypothetical protein
MAPGVMQIRKNTIKNINLLDYISIGSGRDLNVFKVASE